MIFVLPSYFSLSTDIQHFMIEIRELPPFVPLVALQLDLLASFHE